ncbi:hypothetical protein Pcac1_g18851 [Phytophthora cactorum]|nr:hypothetical protein Pcac1_g18851 [Phytophthora cactorum]
MARVVSCRYMRISCSEDDHPLFRRYYARSNRERGVKITTRRSRLTAGATDTRKATQSVWIRADREGESKQTYKSLLTSSDFRCIDRIGRMVSCLCSTTTASPSGSTATIAASPGPSER